MVLISEDTMNHTWEDQGKGDKGANNKQPWPGKCWRCAEADHMAKDCEVSRNTPAANVEIMGTWRSVVSQNRINKAREEAIADIAEGNLEENEMACRR